MRDEIIKKSIFGSNFEKKIQKKKKFKKVGNGERNKPSGHHLRNCPPYDDHHHHYHEDQQVRTSQTQVR